MSEKSKKILAILMVSLMIFSLASCKNKDKNPVEDPPIDSEGGTQIDGPKVVGSVSYDDMMDKLEDAKKINEYAAAWLSIPGTNIDYPVIFNPNEDNDYYSGRTLEGEDINPSYNSWDDTVIYAHFRTSFDPDLNFASKNFTLFGHNWNNITAPLFIGNDDEYTMFGQLPSYTDKEFLEQNPYIYFSTPDNEMVWKIYSVFYCEQDWSHELGGFNYIEPNLTPVQMSQLIISQSERSEFNTNVDVNSEDRILTLSTCSRIIEGAGEEQRFVVVARQLRPGESDKDPIEVIVNSNPKQPVL